MLVNNAGISGESKKINEISTSDWSYVIDVNLKGTFLCTREALNHMLHDSNIADSHGKNKKSSTSNTRFNKTPTKFPPTITTSPLAMPYTNHKNNPTIRVIINQAETSSIFFVFIAFRI